MARLFVIEAPGKARTFQEILRAAGEEAKVQATVGHIFQFPERLDPVGIDSAFREFERKPRDVAILERLRAEAMIADEVVVATDADQEGDAIAWDVATVIRDLHPAPRRMRLRGMDAVSVKEALDNLTDVRKEDAVPARTRAIVDRLIGAGFSGNGVAVGRVGTALLGLVANSKPGVLKLRLVAPAKDGGRPYVAECPVEGILDGKTAERLASIDFPALGQQGSRPAPYRPGNMGDVMVRAGEQLDMSPKETANSMQRLYETGRLSYPRAGSRGFSPTIALKVAEVLRKAGYNSRGERFDKKSEDSVHDAPYPIGKVDLHNDPSQLGQDEGVRATIARDLVRASSGQTHENAITAPIPPFLVSKGFSHEVADKVAGLGWSREVGPSYPGKESWPESEVVRRRPDIVLLERAIDAGLGRPSTWANHISNFMSRDLVNDNLRLTERGQQWVDASPKELLDPRISSAIEQACERFSPALMQDEKREPWELNAERICRALPAAVRSVVERQVAAHPPTPKLDPIEAYGLDQSFVEQAESTRSRAYAPPSQG